jgi:hypothetical protein
MTTDQIDRIHQARPFRPFTLFLADGRQIRVDHPEFMARTRGGRTLFIGSAGEHFEIVDLPLVVSVEVGIGRRRKSA